MNKIPLETTIGGAYRFFFTRILSILGTVWLPFLAMIALWAGTAWLVVPHYWWLGKFPVIDDRNPDFWTVWSIMRPIAEGLPLLILASLIVEAMIIVGLLRLALGEKKHSFVFFDLGGDVWRLILVWIICFFIVIFAEIGVVAAGVIAGFVAKIWAATGWAVAIGILVGIAGACFAVYACVRLMFFLPVVIVAEHRIGFGHSWQLGGGNFWRIVLIFLVIAIPVGIVGGMISNMTVMPVVMGHLMQFGNKPDPAQIQAFLRALPPLIPWFIGVSLLERLAMLGLIAGALGTAYNALTPKQEETKGA